MRKGDKGSVAAAAHNRNHALGLEQGGQLADEVEGEELDRLGAAGEDVVHDVVEAGGGCLGQGCGVAHGVLQHRRAVLLEVKVLDGEVVDDRVDLDNRRLDAVRDEGRGRCADAEAAVCMRGARVRSGLRPRRDCAFAGAGQRGRKKEKKKMMMMMKRRWELTRAENAYMTKAWASSSGTGSALSTRRTASSMTKTP